MSVRALWVGAGVVGGLLAVAASTHASSWTEAGDAGSLPSTAQIPKGKGALASITGTSSFGDVDVYAIRVTGSGTFSAAAWGEFPSVLDAQLYLFDAQGRGVYANGDTSPPDPFHPGRAVLPAGDPLTPTAPGIYFLAISSRHVEPVSEGGLIFPCVGCTPGLVAGPSGPGGGSPITGWSGSPFTAGPYTITLTGAEFSATGATEFHTLAPCRVADTRDPEGPSGGPPLGANSTRTFPVVGLCGVPSTAKSVAINVTVVNATDYGNLRLYAAGEAVPDSSMINFIAHMARANNAVISLGTDGEISVRCDMPPGSTGQTDFLFDVTGYFE